MHLRDHPVRSLLLLLVGLPQAAAGLWAVVSPRTWFDSFPGFGHAWVAAAGPYDAHLAVDAGAGLLATGVLLCGAAMAARRAELRGAIAAFLLFAAIHLGYHLHDLGHMARSDDAADIASLSLAVLVPLGVLVSLRGGAAASAGGAGAGRSAP